MSVSHVYVTEQLTTVTVQELYTVLVPETVQTVTVDDKTAVIVQETITTVALQQQDVTVIVPSEVVTIVEVGVQGPAGPSAPSGSYTAENKEGISLSAGMPVAVHSSGVGVVRASAADNQKNAVGLALLGAAPAMAETVQVGGPVTLSDWTAVTGTATLQARAIYYLSTIPGMLTTTPPETPGQVVQQVGMALSATTLGVEIDEAILL